MNKIQYIKLLEMRGITELKGESLATAVERTGGEPTQAEMVKVNEMAMFYFSEKHKEAEAQVLSLMADVDEMRKDIKWLRCLEAAGVDNWEGYDQAIDIRDGVTYKG